MTEVNRTLRALVEKVLAQVEKSLDAIDKVCYVVDVREKHGSVRPVIATVVDRSDAMHQLLFVRKVLRDELSQALAAQRQEQSDIERYDHAQAMFFRDGMRQHEKALAEAIRQLGGVLRVSQAAFAADPAHIDSAYDHTTRDTVLRVSSSPALPASPRWQCHHCGKDGVGEPFKGTIANTDGTVQHPYFCSGECRFQWAAKLSALPASPALRHDQGLAIAKALRGEISHGKLAEILGIEDVHGFKLAAGSFDEPEAGSEPADSLPALPASLARPAVDGVGQRVAAILRVRADDLTKAACDACEHCGSLVMCSYHSLLSELEGLVEPATAASPARPEEEK